ncbi:adenosine 5'-monophosphoramidase HINT3 isoform X2 [Natator depressus]|uniref:adenosine 5'-monophosphoramidase HINT3 isoform X2 n=1 Tax=Natator depressus TaxID=27790 RepID=UPI003EB720FE
MEPPRRLRSPPRTRALPVAAATTPSASSAGSAAGRSRAPRCCPARDIRPGAPHHYLVVPIEHMGNCKTLKKEHIPLVEKMMEAGKNILQRNNFTDLNDIRMGFHWPPFCSISHLHLHVLAPASQLGFLSRMIYRTNSYWFITAEQLIERLQTENTAS